MRLGPIHPLEGVRIPGSEFVHAARHVQRRCSLLRYRSINLQIYVCDRWRRNRMRVGYWSWRVFFVTIVPLFVSIMFVLQMDRGTMHRSGRMRGRLWICVAINRRMDKEIAKSFSLLILLCSPLVSWSSSIVVLLLRKKQRFSPLLRSVLSIGLALALFRFAQNHSSPFRHHSR